MRKQTLLLLMISIFIGLISVSYAAFSENMVIDGEAIVRAPADIRVTNLSVNNLSNSGFETYNSKYSKEATNTYVTLPNANSSVTYDVTVTNKSSSTYYLKAINELTYDNSNVKYEIIGIDIYDLVNPNSTVTFQIRLTNKTSSRQSVELSLNYIFEEYIVYTITYNLNGGTNPANAPTSYSNISNTITLPTPTISILTFAGWYDNASFTGSAITQIPSGSTGDKTYYAKWNSGVVLTATYTTNNYKTFTVPVSGLYQIQLWGASGSPAMSRSYNAVPGAGAYVSGKIFLEQNDTLYLHVGENYINSDFSIVTAYNGGGSNGNGNGRTDGVSANVYSGTGGGATDVRLVSGTWDNTASLRSRIMVAAGGGGAALVYRDLSTNGHGGGLQGYRGVNQTYSSDSVGHTPSTAGTQTFGGSTITLAANIDNSLYPNNGYGTAGTFGKGGNSNPYTGSGGGGGYYGGGGGGVNNGSMSSGSGGSSFISGHNGCVAIESATSLSPRTGTAGATCSDGTTDIECSKHYSGYVFTDTVMIDGAGYSWTTSKQGQVQMPNPNGGYYTLGTGHIGNGYARITFIEQ